jgi:HSP20 family protein
MMERWRPRGLPFLPWVWGRFPVEEMGWAPAIEVLEKGDKFVVRAELPGMKEEDIDVSVAGDTLIIRGERKAETEVEEENYYCCERSYGSFLRSIVIPSHVNVDKIEANYEDGLLEISLPKAPEVKPKKISVSARKRKAASVVKRTRAKKKEKASK